MALAISNIASSESKKPSSFDQQLFARVIQFLLGFHALELFCCSGVSLLLLGFIPLLQGLFRCSGVILLLQGLFYFSGVILLLLGFIPLLQGLFWCSGVMCLTCAVLRAAAVDTTAPRLSVAPQLKPSQRA